MRATLTGPTTLIALTSLTIVDPRDSVGLSPGLLAWWELCDATPGVVMLVDITGLPQNVEGKRILLAADRPVTLVVAHLSQCPDSKVDGQFPRAEIFPRHRLVRRSRHP